MPTYEYKCKSCGMKFEKFQSMTDAPLTDDLLAKERLNEL